MVFEKHRHMQTYTHIDKCIHTQSKYLMQLGIYVYHTVQLAQNTLLQLNCAFIYSHPINHSTAHRHQLRGQSQAPGQLGNCEHPWVNHTVKSSIAQ